MRDEKAKNLGRPKKGKERRIPVTFYVSMSDIDDIDGYVEEQKVAGDRSYSRSEFVNEAIHKHMKEVGIESENEE